MCSFPRLVFFHAYFLFDVVEFARLLFFFHFISFVCLYVSRRARLSLLSTHFHPALPLTTPRTTPPPALPGTPHLLHARSCSCHSPQRMPCLCTAIRTHPKYYYSQTSNNELDVAIDSSCGACEIGVDLRVQEDSNCVKIRSAATIPDYVII